MDETSLERLLSSVLEVTLEALLSSALEVAVDEALLVGLTLQEASNKVDKTSKEAFGFMGLFWTKRLQKAFFSIRAPLFLAPILAECYLIFDMKHAVPFLLTLSVLTLASCHAPQGSLSWESEDWSSGSSAASDTSASEQSTTPAKDFITGYMEKLSSLTSYKSVTKGTTKAKVLFIETTQTIDVTSIKSEYRYLKNESHGAVDTVHEAYFHNDATLVKNLGEEKYSPKTLEEYLSAYGVNPYGRNIEGYSVSKEAIVSVEEIEANSHLVTFDPAKATNNVRIQMKAFGGLDDYPIFSHIEILIKTDADLTPLTYNVKADYKARRFGFDSDCHQEYEVTFSEVNQSPEIPNLEQIKEEYKF